MKFILDKNHLLEAADKIKCHATSKCLISELSVENIACMLLSSNDLLMNIQHHEEMDIEYITEKLDLAYKDLKSGFILRTFPDLKAKEDKDYTFDIDGNIVFSLEEEDISYIRGLIGYYSILEDGDIAKVATLDLNNILSVKSRYLSDSFYLSSFLDEFSKLLTKNTLSSHPGMTDLKGASILNFYMMISGGDRLEIKLKPEDYEIICNAINKHSKVIVCVDNIKRLVDIGNPDTNRVFYQILRFSNDTYYYDVGLSNSMNLPKIPVIKGLIIQEIKSISSLVLSLILQTENDPVPSNPSLRLSQKYLERGLKRLKDLNIMHKLVVDEIEEQPLKYFDLLIELAEASEHCVYSWMDKLLIGKPF